MDNSRYVLLHRKKQQYWFQQTLVQDYQTVQADAQKLVSMAGGQGALTTANQQTLHDEFNPVRPIRS